MTQQTRTLYRPVGPIELKLIIESQSTRFPPRLAEQPIFYPVLNIPYAEQIARQWNTQSGNRAGFVTQFEVDAKFIEQFPEQVVGAESVHRELWVPAEQLEEFNQHLAPPIQVLSAWYGEGYVGVPGQSGLLKGLKAIEQFDMLDMLGEQALSEELSNNRSVLQVNLIHWRLGERADSVLVKRLSSLWPPEWNHLLQLRPG